MKIAILTNFMDFNPGYSLTEIVKDQARMLTQYGHDVFVFVNSQYNFKKGNFCDDIEKAELVPKIPFAHLTDYTRLGDVTDKDKEIIKETAKVLEEELADFDFVYTHDFLFTGWFLIYGLACREVSPKLPHLRWLHWIHSVPTRNSDWWDIKQWGPNHKLIFPNRADRIRVAEQYRGTASDVRVIPHIKDPRSWWDFHEDTREFLKRYPNVMQADILKIYPASTDRLAAKGVDKVLVIMRRLKEMGQSVCFICANQWATVKERKEDVARYYELAEKNGLVPDREFIFTSEFDTKFAVGIPARMLRELMLLSNLFIFPTKEESFGLVGPEAALSGVMMCLNGSLDSQREIHGSNGLFFDFGSFNREHNIENPGAYYRDLAIIIFGRMRENEAICSKTWARQRFNWDYLYNTYYAPIMAEAKMWV